MRKLTTKGADFLVRHEGFVKRAYHCPAGVLTIGSGFTMRSATARKHWMETRGRKLRKGDRITVDENRLLLQKAVHEYFRPVDRALPGANQHEWEASGSYLFNCGLGAAKDTWFKIARTGDIKGAVARLRRSRCTARGKPLRGLRIRRGHEAKLFEHGDYGDGGVESHRKGPVTTKTSRELKEYQIKLATLGFDPGKADGWMGPNTERAVLAFQKKHPNLENDGILGKATKISVDRAMKAAQQAGKAGGAAAAVVVGTGAGAALQATRDASDWTPYLFYGVAVAAVAGIIYLAWKHWPEIEHRIGDLFDDEEIEAVL